MKDLEKLCIYYGDCPFNFSDCQEDEPWFICPKYQIEVEKTAKCDCQEFDK